MHTPRPLSERLWAKVDRDDPSGCWIWHGNRDPLGYGRIGSGGKYGRALLVHRVAYELERGSIPDGLHLDHTCRNPSCVNPAHLDAVTAGENVRRANERLGRKPGPHALKTHCVHGHPLEGDNIKIRESDGQRLCRQCARDRVMKSKWTRRGVDPATREPFRTGPRATRSR